MQFRIYLADIAGTLYAPLWHIWYTLVAQILTEVCVLEHLHEYDLNSKSEKCLFHTQKIEFLGFMVTPTGHLYDTAKNWCSQHLADPE